MTAETMKVIPPEGWGPCRALMTELEHLGCNVTEYRKGGRSELEITVPEGRHIAAGLRRRGYTVERRDAGGRTELVVS